MFQLVLELLDFCLQLSYPSLEQLFLGLGEFGFFLLGYNQFLHFLFEKFLSISDSLFMFDFVFIQHFFVHKDLFSESGLNSVPLFHQLAEPIFEQTVESFRRASFATFLLDFFESGHLSEKHIVSQFARSVSERSISTLPKLFG